MQKRIEEGDDRHFEEQRSYQAYPFLRDPKRIRIFGIIGVIAGTVTCVLSLYQS